MKKLLAIVLIVFSSIGYACDNCNVYLGINPNDFYHNIGLRLRTRYHQGTFDNTGSLMLKHGVTEPIITNSTIRETYQRIELTGKYFWNLKWNTQVVVPYVRNTQEINESVEYFVQGVGDAMIIQNYMLFNAKDLSDSLVFKHRLTLGLGLKIATGKIDIERPKGIPNIDLQPGTGSWDGVFSTTYSAMYNKSGLMVNGNYKLNTFNKDDFKYGNTINVTASLFYLMKIKENMQLMPNFGVYIETFDKDHLQEELVNESGGSTWMLDGGLSWYFGKFKTQFNYQYAIENKLVSQQQIPTLWRYNLGVYYNF